MINKTYMTARADGMMLSAYLVWDEFLQRTQVRVMTAAEYFLLFYMLTSTVRDQTGYMPDLVIISQLTTPSYGSKKWRGKQ